MTKQHNHNTLYFRILLILLSTGLVFFLLFQHYYYSGIFTAVVTICLLIELRFFLKDTFLVYERTIASILQNDFSSDFSQHRKFANYSQLFTLYDQLKYKQHETLSKDLVYRALLNTIESGILILEKNDVDWSIFVMNDYFSEHFQVPKVSKWKYLRNQFPALCQLIEDLNFSEVKTTLDIRVNQQDTQTFMMQASRTKTFQTEYYIVLLDSIQKVIEKKEKEAWINLMKVIAHELLNSLTPIRSLSQNIYELTQQTDLTQEDIHDIQQSVATMRNRSDHLQEFVESYRKLAMLPTPQKSTVELSKLLNQSIQIMQPLFKNADIKVYNEVDFDRRIFVDPQQMEQVLINLLTNSYYALLHQEQRTIYIKAESKEKRLFITLTDTGNGIEPEIEDKVFLPFFTTRKEGAGIGLTLSKNIIEAHGGYLAFQQKEGRTTFIICLLDPYHFA